MTIKSLPCVDLRFVERASLGTHGGGWTKIGDEDWFAKPGDFHHVCIEVMVSMCYRAMGIPTPQFVVGKMGNEIYVCSKRLFGRHPTKEELPSLFDALKGGFCADVMFSHLDVIGPSNGNLVCANGVVYRIDFGGCMCFRGSGRRRDFLPDVTPELEGLMDAGVNSAGMAYMHLTEADMVASARSLALLPLSLLRSVCFEIGMRREFSVLMDRRAALMSMIPQKPVRVALRTVTEIAAASVSFAEAVESSVDRRAAAVLKGENDAVLLSQKLSVAADAVRRKATMLKELLFEFYTGRGAVGQGFSFIATAYDPGIDVACRWLSAQVIGCKHFSRVDFCQLAQDYMLLCGFCFDDIERFRLVLDAWLSSTSSAAAVAMKLAYHVAIGNDPKLETTCKWYDVPASMFVDGAIDKQAVYQTTKLSLDKLVACCKAMSRYSAIVVPAMSGKRVQRLYRGMPSSVYSSVSNQFGNGFCEIDASILSSFSEKASVARHFGSTVLFLDVMPENIFLSHSALGDWLTYDKEFEFIVVCPGCKYSLFPWQVSHG